MAAKSSSKKSTEKMSLLSAIDKILADPEDIKEETNQIFRKYCDRYCEDRELNDVRAMVANRVIKNYSYLAAFSGGVTALSGVVPGLGTVISSTGGATADIALTMKFQIEMVMAIAHIYEHDILTEEKKRLCFVIAGLGAISQTGQQSSKEISSKAFAVLVNEQLQKSSKMATSVVFRQVTKTLATKAVQKSIPLGVGVVIGFSVNQSLSWFVGTRARDYLNLADSIECA